MSKIESGYWFSNKNDSQLPSDVLAEVTVLVRSDGSIGLKVRSAEHRSLDGMVADITAARDRIDQQINERFTRCPLYRVFGTSEPQAAGDGA